MKKPNFVLLENVANLKTHDDGKTLKTIISVLQEMGYYVRSKILSPHQFGLPQHRPRIFIVAINKSKVKNYLKFRFPHRSKKKEKTCHVDLIFDSNSSGEISKKELFIFKHWTKFLNILPKNITPPSPTWSMDFGRTYDLDNIHPIFDQTEEKLRDILNKEGIFTKESCSKKELLLKFPPYIRKMRGEMPEWKRKFILKNRDFWLKHGNLFPEEWLKTTRTFNETEQKFEWHVGKSASRDVMDYMIHKRPSGIRVSKLDRIPALVAIAQFQLLALGVKLSPREAANAQNFLIMHYTKKI